MRYHQLRFDIWLCLLLSFLLSLVPVKIAEKVLPQKYEEYSQEHTVEEGDIGGVAKEDVFKAQSIEDLLSHDTFTVVSPGIQYRNRGGGYYNGGYMNALTLPSGEIVAARINEEAVTHEGESIFSGDSILPVGKIVYEDLTTHETFLHQIEYSEKLSRTDFYIDMLGNGGKMSREDYTEAPMTMIQVITIFVAFPILHALGAKIGIFPYFWAPRKKQKSEWE